jgi:hypothetical protein
MNNPNVQDNRGAVPLTVDNTEESLVLLSPTGEMLPALDRFAKALFNKLDQTVAVRISVVAFCTKKNSIREYLIDYIIIVALKHKMS